ncbi:hypothetical protein [Paenibacillus sp. D51F]
MKTITKEIGFWIDSENNLAKQNDESEPGTDMNKVKKKKSVNPWEGLNKRQQLYLTAIYETDQDEERNAKASAAIDRHSRPADEWRWLPYGYDQYGNMLPLMERIHSLNLIDQGTGSTFKALESRGMISLRWEPTTLVDKIPIVRITAKGRRVVRKATGEVRPKKQPAVMLREWHWRALSMAYQAYLEKTEGLLDEWGTASYGGISWNTWLRLRGYRLNGEYIQLVKEHQNREAENWRLWYYVMRITPEGVRFYIREWNRYHELYPDVDAPAPNQERGDAIV